MCARLGPEVWPLGRKVGSGLLAEEAGCYLNDSPGMALPETLSLGLKLYGGARLSIHFDCRP